MIHYEPSSATACRDAGRAGCLLELPVVSRWTYSFTLDARPTTDEPDYVSCATSAVVQVESAPT